MCADGATLNFSCSAPYVIPRLIATQKAKKELISECLIWHYFVQLCQAVHYLHDNCIIHRGTFFP